MLDTTETRKDLGRPRLPVDRCFTVAGFGTVVTGTLIDGTLRVGQEVQLALSEERGRIRGLQSHRKKTEEAEPGVRLAVNLSGLSRDDVERGEMLTTVGWLQPATRMDAHVKMLRDASQSLKHNEVITFHLFTSESSARVRLLDNEELKAGEEGWAQLHFRDPVPAVKGDLFVIRSADATLGGGTVVDPHPSRRHRRCIPAVLEQLAAMEEGTGQDALISAIDQWGPCDLKSISQKANLPMDEVLSGTAELAEGGQVVLLGDGAAQPDTLVYSRNGWSTLVRKSSDMLQAYHVQHPLRRGIPREELRSRLGLAQATFPWVMERLVHEEALTEEGAAVRLPGHEAALSPAQQKQVESYIKSLESEPFSPPTDQSLDGELLTLLMDEGKVVKVNESVVFAATAYETMVERIIAHTREQGKITVADGRDLFNTSRKYILPLLEHLDQQHITRRVGDERVLR
jgi:selenocysteine-specific elongation factor